MRLPLLKPPSIPSLSFKQMNERHEPDSDQNTKDDQHAKHPEMAVSGMVAFFLFKIEPTEEKTG